MKVLHICLACFYIENFGYQENLLPISHKKLGYEVKILAPAQINKNGNLKYIENDYINNYGIEVGIIKYKKSKAFISVQPTRVAESARAAGD